MKRSLAVASAEFQALIRTKFFIVGIVLLPVMVFASFTFTNYAEKHIDTDPHRIAIFDRTGVLMPDILAAAEAPDAKVVAPDRIPADDTETPVTDTVVKPAQLTIVPVSVTAGKSIDDIRVELSAAVKDKSLFSFVEIPPEVLTADDKASIDYYTLNLSNRNVPAWLGKTINKAVTRARFDAAHVDLALTDKLSKTPAMTTRSLVERAADGTVQRARVVHRLENFVVAFILMYLMLLSIMMSAPHMMNAVIEEKMSRISEVLLASVTPTELLAGKLIGIASVTVLLALLYLIGGIYVAFSSGEAALVQFALVPWFLVFLLCAVLMFGSIFLSIGAACADLKDAQSMMQPAMFFMLIPIFMAPMVMSAPNSTMAVVLSMIPTATPFIMLMRLSLTPPPPMWQVLLSVVITASTAALFVWAAGRIFRVGLLMQGKAPNLPELLKWIRA
jgi:ABC-2 type transport system permease protein